MASFWVPIVKSYRPWRARPGKPHRRKTSTGSPLIPWKGALKGKNSTSFPARETRRGDLHPAPSSAKNPQPWQRRRGRVLFLAYQAVHPEERAISLCLRQRRILPDASSRRRRRASQSLHLRQVVNRTFTLKLSIVPGTARKGGPPAAHEVKNQSARSGIAGQWRRAGYCERRR